jgi:hypothetical protein
MYTNRTMFMEDTLSRIVVPSTNWKSYSYKLNLKQDYSGKISFGFGNAGTFDLDSISLIRLGDAVLSGVRPVSMNNANVYAVNNQIVVNSQIGQHVDVYALDGTKLLSTKVPTGEHKITVNRAGIYIVRLTNKNGVFSQKVLLSTL